MVSVDVTRFNREAARRCQKMNVLPSDCREVQFNPVAACAGRALSRLDSGQVESMVPVEISDRK